MRESWCPLSAQDRHPCTPVQGQVATRESLKAFRAAHEKDFAMVRNEAHILFGKLTIQANPELELRKPTVPQSAGG